MKRVKRAVFRAWLHGADALVKRLDLMLGTTPRDLIWVPEARPVEADAWEDRCG